jgi:ribonuclease P protein component
MIRPGERAAPAPGESHFPAGGNAPKLRAREDLPRYRRIGRREGFDLAPGPGVSSNEWFVVYARPNRLGVSRLGVTVPKRVAQRANARNFAKRLVREGFRRAFPVACAVNVIVRVRKRLDRNTAQQGAVALARLLRGVQEKCGKY